MGRGLDLVHNAIDGVFLPRSKSRSVFAALISFSNAALALIS